MLLEMCSVLKSILLDKSKVLLQVEELGVIVEVGVD